MLSLAANTAVASGTARQQLAGVVARLGGPITLDDVRYRGAGLFQRPSPADDALLSLDEILRAGDVHHRLMAETEQVTCRQPRSRAASRLSPPTPLSPGRPRRPRRAGRRGSASSAESREATGAMMITPATACCTSRDTDSLSELLVDRAHARDRDRVTSTPRGLLDRVQRCYRTEQHRVQRDQTQLGGAATGEGTRREVRPVAKLLDGRKHALARGGSHVGVSVEHA